jgi:hypothetical protein
MKGLAINFYRRLVEGPASGYGITGLEVEGSRDYDVLIEEPVTYSEYTSAILISNYFKC